MPPSIVADSVMIVGMSSFILMVTFAGSPAGGAFRYVHIGRVFSVPDCVLRRGGVGWGLSCVGCGPVVRLAHLGR